VEAGFGQVGREGGEFAEDAILDGGRTACQLREVEEALEGVQVAADGSGCRQVGDFGGLGCRRDHVKLACE